MGEECAGFVNKDSLVIKPTKKYPLVLMMVVVALTAISGSYICLICLKQYGILIRPDPLKIGKTKQHCRVIDIPQSEVPYVHYPEPTTYNRDECACTPVRHFAILSTQRSGSGWFETLLNSHPNVSSNGEIFSVKPRRSNISTITETLDKVYNLDWYSSAAKNECTAAFGFKWMLNQGLMANHAEIVEYFNRKGVSAVFLFRRNLLRRLVSIISNLHDQHAKQLNGTHKAHVHSKNEADILARYKPTIDASTLTSNLKSTDKLSVDALEYFKSTRHIVLYYEDIIKNHTKLMDVLEFLRVPQIQLASRHVKIHTRPLSDQVENWNSVYNALKGTAYESFLEADYQM